MSQSTARLVVVTSQQADGLYSLYQAITEQKLNATICRVVCINRQASAINWAKKTGLNWSVIDKNNYRNLKDFNRALASQIKNTQADWVILNNLCELLNEQFIDAFSDKLINFYLNACPIQDSNSRFGASVHFVSTKPSAQHIIRQGSIRIPQEASKQTLTKRYQKYIAPQLYPAALNDLISGRILYQNGQLTYNGQPQKAPIHEDYDFQTLR